MKLSHCKLLLSIGLLLLANIRPGFATGKNLLGHDLLQAAFGRHVSEGLVDYLAIAADKDFKSYLNWLADFDPETIASRDGQMAFWINAYNALAIESVIRASPVIAHDRGRASSRDLAKEMQTRKDGQRRPIVVMQLIGSVLDDPGFFNKREMRVAGGNYTLNQVEKELIFPKFGEARLHFMLVCAALSCPELSPGIYTEENLTEKMAEVTRKFLSNGAKNFLDREEKNLHLSQIFNWYKDDFVEHGGVIDFILPYLDQSDRTFIQENKVTIRFLEYDWSLNVQM